MTTPASTSSDTTRALRLDLSAEAASLRESAPYQANGYATKTLVKTATSRVLLIALRAGARIVEHKTPHPVRIQTLVGRVRLSLPNETVELPAGALLLLDASVPHDVSAEEESALRLDIDWV